MAARSVTTLAGLGNAYLLSLTEGECPTGKWRFPSADAAARALGFLVLRAVRSLRRQERGYYQCGHCAGYHTTSIPQQESV